MAEGASSALELVETAGLYLDIQQPPQSPDSTAGRGGGGLPERPSVRLGRQLSVKRRRVVGVRGTAADGAEEGETQQFQREAVRYRSLQHRPRRSESPVRVRRASSLTVVNRYEQWEDLTVTFGNLRQSSRRLEDRIAQHRQTLSRRPQMTRRNTWKLFLNVHWPKLKSRLRVVYGYELWNGHLKEVEGHFGTAVVSYFIFLRWLFLMNLVIFLLWFGLAVIPQLVWVAGTNAARSPSQLACVFPLNTSGGPHACPDGEVPEELTAMSSSLSAEVFQTHGHRLLCTGGELDQEDGRFTVGRCQFDTENGTQVARRENPDRSVSGLASCLNITEFTGVEFYYVCPRDIDPVVRWYQYIFDFALGRGIFNDTVLFHGRYTNETVEVVERVRYNLPLAYILLTGSVFLISVVLLVYKMGQAYNESNLKLSRRQNINYCNKLFSSWDFSITDHSSAKLRRAQIKRQFEEDIADLQKRSKKRDLKEWLLVILSRTLTNLFVLLILVGAGVAVFMAAQLGLQSQLSGNSLQLEGFVLPVVFTTFNISLPILFSFLARFERFKTQSGEIRMTLIRAIMVRLSSLVVLFITLLILISCTQSFEGGGGEEEMQEDEGTCQFSVPDITIGSDNDTRQFQNSNCPQCWETFVGQELYKLGLVNFVLSAITTISVETTRNYLSRLPHKIFSERLGKGNFNIAKSILDLIYTQALLWLGFFYSPFLPFVILVTSFMLFYIKKYSLIWNLTPSNRGAFKAARTNFLFLFLLLAVLLASLIPIGYTVARLHPSETCGPFRGKELIYDVVTEFLEQADCRVQQVFDYVQSTSFLLPIIMVLLLLCYAQWVVLKGRKHRFVLLKKQLVLEAADLTFYGQQLQLQTNTEVGVVREERGVAPLQQRLSALQDMAEGERGVATREEERGMAMRESKLSIPSYRLSRSTSST